MRAALPAKRALLAAKRTAAAAVLATDHPTFGAALTAAGTLLPVDDVDPQPLDFTAFGDRAVTVCADIVRAVAAVAAAGTAAAAAVSSQLTAYDAAATDADRGTALTAAAQALFGPSFLFLPEFVLPADQVAGLDRRRRRGLRRRAHPVPHHDGGHPGPGAGVGCRRSPGPAGAARVGVGRAAAPRLRPARARAHPGPAAVHGRGPVAGDAVPGRASRSAATGCCTPRVTRTPLTRPRISAACSSTSGPRSSPPRPRTPA